MFGIFCGDNGDKVAKISPLSWLLFRVKAPVRMLQFAMALVPSVDKAGPLISLFRPVQV